MRYFFIFLLTLLTLGCSGGGDEAPITQTTTPSVTPVNVPSGATQLPLIIIQVEFLDYTFRSDTLTWYNKIFGTSNGQLNHYFSELSQNSFLFIPAHENDYVQNDGIIRIQLNQNHPNSGINNFDNIAIPAITLADEFIDFAQYDTNKNSQIDIDELQIMFLVAGGESASGPRNVVDPSIWAHQFFINNITLDGVSVMQYPGGSYTAFGERHFDINSGPDASIGIIAHELGHGAFYLPDLYDTDLSSSGIGHFGLMGSGSWGYAPGKNPGETPTHMSAWSKIKVQFVEPELVTVDTLNKELIATDAENYKPVRINTANSDEYFLIENRSSSGYDSGLYALDDIASSFEGGIAIWHIDESQASNTYPNDDDTQRLVDLEESDTLYLEVSQRAGNQTNLYYAGNGTGNFNNFSTPSNSKLNNATASNIDLSNPSTRGSLMYIDINLP